MTKKFVDHVVRRRLAPVPPVPPAPDRETPDLAGLEDHVRVAEKQLEAAEAELAAIEARAKELQAALADGTGTGRPDDLDEIEARAPEVRRCARSATPSAMP
jgi:multidrug efflux pump subunit AcrA (membrane-fusion protein)